MVGIYARVSTEEQAKSGFSLQNQIRECVSKAATREYKEYMDEGISGEFLDRPALTRLRQDVRDGIITKVVCLDPDRLSRKLMNQLIITEDFDRCGVELVFVNGEYARTPEGTLFYSMRGAIAEFEKAKITERMGRGRREKARQGKIVKNPNTFGYNYDKETCQITINEAEANVVRLIYDLFTTPGSSHVVRGINGIAHYLTKKRIPTKKGKEIWHRQVVRQILLNETYTGVFYQNRWNTEGMLANKHLPAGEKISLRERGREDWIAVSCPEIISKEQFNHAQHLLGESRRRFAKQPGRDYLLSGLLRCTNCGNTMTGRKARNWGKDTLEYTDIKNTAGARHKGCGHRLNQEKMDQAVWDCISSWLMNAEEIQAASQEVRSADPDRGESGEIQRLQHEIEKNRAGCKRLLSLFAEGLDIGQEEVRERMLALKEKEQKLLSDLEQQKQRLNEFQLADCEESSYQEAVTYYLCTKQEELTFQDRQIIIRALVQEILVSKDKIQIILY
jgi:site-specific DNA recombinase